jgi:hypothetical protein
MTSSSDLNFFTVESLLESLKMIKESASTLPISKDSNLEVKKKSP